MPLRPLRYAELGKLATRTGGRRAMRLNAASMDTRGSMPPRNDVIGISTTSRVLGRARWSAGDRGDLRRHPRSRSIESFRGGGEDQPNSR